MSRRGNFVRVLLPPSARLILGIILVAVAAGLLAGASTIALRAHPGVVTEYGRTAALFVTTGKIFALLAGTLVFLQFALGAKLKVLDRVFGLHRLLFAHRFLGVSAAVFASIMDRGLHRPLAGILASAVRGLVSVSSPGHVQRGGARHPPRSERD
jgi:hypothetical protein